MTRPDRVPVRRRARPAAMAAALGALLAGCGGDGRQLPEREVAPPSTSDRARLTATEFQAGLPAMRVTATNPYEGNEAAAADGERLYGWMNCGGCHGAYGGGGIGPPLRDADWIYGSSAASIFETIAQGRPNGMPAFGPKLPDDQIWKLVLHVQSLGGEHPVVPPGGASGESPTAQGGGG